MGIIVSIFDDDDDKQELPEESKEEDEPIQIESVVPKGVSGFSPSDFPNIPELNIKKLVLLMRHLNYEL